MSKKLNKSKTTEVTEEPTPMPVPSGELAGDDTVPEPEMASDQEMEAAGLEAEKAADKRMEAEKAAELEAAEKAQAEADEAADAEPCSDSDLKTTDLLFTFKGNLKHNGIVYKKGTKHALSEENIKLFKSLGVL